MTGTAAWMFRAVLDYMLGIQPEVDGLTINPCINEEWDEYQVERAFRKNLYKIHVYNPNHKQTGVSYMLVDGERVDGNHIQYVDDGMTHTVEVYM
jgi:cellobiose phosphorylase